MGMVLKQISTSPLAPAQKLGPQAIIPALAQQDDVFGNRQLLWFAFEIYLRLQTYYFSFRKIAQQRPLIPTGAVKSAECFPETALWSQVLLPPHYRFVFQDRQAEQPETSVWFQKDGSDED